MGVIKQLKKLGTNVKVYPITKTNAVYDDEKGRLDSILRTTLSETEKDASVSGSLANQIQTVSEEVSEINTKVTSVVNQSISRLTAVESEVDTLSTQVSEYDSRIEAKADNSVTFTEATTLTNLVSGETISTSFGKITKGITDFLSHIKLHCTSSVWGHVKLSDTYSSVVPSSTANNGLGASQSAVYNCYASLLEKFNMSMRSRGNKSSATLDILDLGIWRISDLTAGNSPSGADTQGVLINASALNMTTNALSTTFQIFYGKDSNTVYARLQWNDAWTNTWIKISN